MGLNSDFQPYGNLSQKIFDTTGYNLKMYQKCSEAFSKDGSENKLLF